jgi:hypothetical protein
MRSYRFGRQPFMSLHVFGPIIGIVIIFGVVLVLVALGGP